MSWVKTGWRRFRLLSRMDSFECEIKAELLFHVEMRTLDNVEAGMSLEEARKAALERFGDVEHYQTLCSQVRQESQAAKMAKLVNFGVWIMVAIGIAFTLANSSIQVRQIRHLLIAIALLLRLFHYARNWQHRHSHPHPAQYNIRLTADDKYKTQV